MNKLKTKEEKVDKFISGYIESLKISEEKRKEILSDTNYLKWLEGFTIEHQSFSDNDWIYFSEKISKEDNENIKNLHLLFEGIELYAKKNYIYPTRSDLGVYYNIKLDNIGYEIGMLVGQGTLFFCNRKSLNKDLIYIDFNDILNDKKNSNVDGITQQLKELSNKILELYKNGIPLDALIETLDSSLLEIKNEEKNITKKLKRN